MSESKRPEAQEIVWVLSHGGAHMLGEWTRDEALALVEPLVDSALRAVEQRTRLETLERAAKAICETCRKVGLPDKVPCCDRPAHSTWKLFWRHVAENVTCDAPDVLLSEIASLQSREACPHGPHVHEVFRSGVKEGEITCDGPREAPKAEEPKRRKLRHGPLCRYEEIGQCECEPQPGPEEGR